MNGERPETGESEERLRAEVERLKAEKAALQAELNGKKIEERKPFPWRNLVAWIFVVIAFFTAVAAPLASWSHDYMLDTERFIDTIAPLVREDAVAQAISERAAYALIEGLEVEELLQEILPEGIAFIAAPLSGSIQGLAQRSAKAILQSDQFYWVWERILRLAHSTAVDAIRGESAVKVTEQGDVVLDLGELLQNLKNRLVEEGLGFMEKVPIPKDAGMFVLFTADELGLARGGVHLLDTMNWVLPLLAVLLFAAAIAISSDRRKFLMASGIAIALAMAISLIAINFTENQLLGLVEVETNLLAAQVVWNRLFRGLVQVQWGLLALGVVVAGGAAVAGPYGWATWLRSKIAHLFEAWQDRRRRGVKEPGPVGKFVEAHKMAFRVSGLVLIVFVLLLLPKVTAAAVIASSIAFLVYLVVIELLRAPAPAEGAGEETIAGDEGAGDSGKDEKTEEAEEGTSGR
ncbi:MAG: hypothetical protein C4536_00560 [Actinobacteria bacterium]|jgi:hypothetical protein|nr:MAG: hypothetical protein C4536_00560 [Actinomycetota bacterium]